MVAFVGLVELLEFRVRPVEFTRVYRYTPDGRAVTPQPFGQGMAHDIGSILDGL